MRELFCAILAVQDMRGVALLGADGAVLFEEWRGAASLLGSAAGAIPTMTAALKGNREAELVFARGRVCLRDTPLGVLVAVTGPGSPAAMVRLHLDLIVPSLTNKPTKKGLLGLFGAA